MARLSDNPRIPLDVKDPNFVSHLVKLFRETANQMNPFVEGRISAVTNASTAAPTAGQYQIGDYVRNSAPAEAGTAGSKYVIKGWICTAAGTPGTWLQDRCLTGN